LILNVVSEAGLEPARLAAEDFKSPAYRWDWHLLSGAFSDAFEVIHGRLSASQFNATEVASYMSSLVEQIVETERFGETLRPSIDGLMVGMDPGPAARVPGAGPVRQGGRG
jgi:hypothetical protein